MPWKKVKQKKVILRKRVMKKSERRERLGENMVKLQRRNLETMSFKITWRNFCCEADRYFTIRPTLSLVFTSYPAIQGVHGRATPMDASWANWKFSPTLHDMLRQLEDIPRNLHDNDHPQWNLLLESTKPHLMMPEEPAEVVERNKEESLIHTSFSGPDPQIEPLPRASQLLLSDGPTEETFITSQADETCHDNLNIEQLLSLSDNQVSELFSQLSQEDSSILPLIETVCSSSQTRLATLVCSNLLLPLFMSESDEQRGRTLIRCLVQLTTSFPGVSVEHLLLPLLTGPEPEISKLDAAITTLSLQFKTALLSGFLDHVTTLEEWHTSIIQPLYPALQDPVSMQRFVALLAVSAGPLVRSTRFGRLLESVARLVHPDTLPSSVIHQLNTIFASHKTIYSIGAKTILESALEEC
uniref:Fanconi Anaemia group E protein C-terminal domain-containing protein n=1 Tax=Timema monikensis TaxID=170555 RepID=A0A7R9DWR3_9NEOP|nr:unnamed protein product [Timema monikensis]